MLPFLTPRWNASRAYDPRIRDEPSFSVRRPAREDVAAATALAISAGGAVSSLHTTVLLCVEETLEALQKESAIHTAAGR